ncbi:hypothetical protein PMIN06_009589 [Paraphaeosphaeria minitans]
MSSQGPTVDNFTSSSQPPVFSQESVPDSNAMPALTAESSSHKRKRRSDPEALASSSQVTATPPLKRKDASSYAHEARHEVRTVFGFNRHRKNQD